LDINRCRYIVVLCISQAWKNWFDEDAPEECTIPDGYSTTLDTFRKLLLIRSWCPDRTVPMAKTYIAEAMGPRVCGSEIK
jgi:dynein heavy chain